MADVELTAKTKLFHVVSGRSVIVEAGEKLVTSAEHAERMVADGVAELIEESKGRGRKADAE